MTKYFFRSHLIAGVVAVLLLVAVVVGVIFAIRSGKDSDSAGVNKFACIERHLKLTGILEEEYRSVHTKDTGSSDADCHPVIEELRKTSFEPFKNKIESDPKSEPIKGCLLSGLEKSDLTDQIIATKFFDKVNMNDTDRFQKASNGVASSVMSVTLGCAAKMGPGLFGSGLFGPGTGPPQGASPSGF